MIRSATSDDDLVATTPVDSQLIDRLVDGELPDDQRRDLLRALDVEPDGWRRCAIAFIEAQSWQQALFSGETKLQLGVGVNPLQMVTARPSRRRAGTSHWWGSIAAAAAAAFLIGAMAGGAWSGGRSTELAQEQSPETVIHAAQEDVSPHDPRAPRQLATADPRGFHVNTVSLDRLGMNLPISVAGDAEAARDLLTRQQPALSDYGRQVLQRQGIEVEPARRTSIALPLDGGRQIELPVEKVTYRYVGQRLH